MTRRRRRESESDARVAGFYRTTDEEFDAQCGRLVAFLAPTLSNSARWNIYDRTMRIDLVGAQVKLLLDELTLLAQYKADQERWEFYNDPANREPANDSPGLAVIRVYCSRCGRRVSLTSTDPETGACRRCRRGQ